MGHYSSEAQSESWRANWVRGEPGKQSGHGGQRRIREWLNHVRFRKAVFGGVQESDVWKKIAELNTLYENALAAERMRYDSILEERAEAMAKELYRQMVSGEAGQEKAGDVEEE